MPKKKKQKLKLYEILEICLAGCQDDQPGLSDFQENEIKDLISILANSDVNSVTKLERILYFWENNDDSQ